MTADLATLGKEPIPGDNPVGSDVRYEPDFEALQTEIDKLASPSASGQVDWQQIVETAARILSDQSKDLTVASYLAVGLLHIRKVDGLDEGIQVLTDLMESYWDTLYPPKKRMRGREGALTWWLERTEAELQKIKPDPLPADQVERLHANLKRIDAILMEHMPDPPLLRPVQRRVEAFAVQKTDESSEPTPPSPEQVPPAPQAASRPAASKPPAHTQAATTVASDQDAMRAADAAFQSLRQPSLFLLQSDLKNPLAFRYRRIASWAQVDTLPPSTDGATQIPPPPPQDMETLSELRDEGNWPALIQNAEQKLSQYIFWFDLNRYVAEALNSLGADHKKALTAVCQETAYLVQRLPGITALGFNDETPFADIQTRKWLESIALGEAVAQAPSTSGSVTGTIQDDRFSAILEKARAMARKRKLVDAINLLQQEMVQSVSRRQKMRWRLAIAQVLLGVKKQELALPHLEQILSDIEEFHLEAWDPPLAMEGLNAAWRGFGSQSANEHKARAAALLHRIAKIDPAEALRLNK